MVYYCSAKICATVLKNAPGSRLIATLRPSGETTDYIVDFEGSSTKKTRYSTIQIGRRGFGIWEALKE
jgi:hypothetical protein